MPVSLFVHREYVYGMEYIGWLLVSSVIQSLIEQPDLMGSCDRYWPQKSLQNSVLVHLFE